ncbi:hypothetical protein J2S00_002159 [Caldalkalibacillus uzonensis]|uniref:DUF600 family protein n=1 Tax=Caldalkalibacillus uzonensis TaxID=353224 RepID=A0ABU0CTE1_9BACI|nr:hypothetical protein [Caldalkalibacillus uzonensis]MDQ0339372.1 hypothetical protein [Caldalkalibacillus uzonensis]
MEHILRKLQPVLGINRPLQIAKTEWSYEVVDEETGEVYGTITFDENGRFLCYDKCEDAEMEMEQAIGKGMDATKQIETILQRAEAFVQAFVEKEVYFVMMNECDDEHYMVLYQERDPKLGISIPHTG